MYVRTTSATFRSGTTDEALRIFRDVMLPHAQIQPGFRGALVVRRPGSEQGVMMTFWTTEADLRASSPPPEIAPQLARLDDLIQHATQDIYEVVLHTLSSEG